MFVLKFTHETHGNTSYFTLTNNFKNQYEEINEANEKNSQLDDCQEGERGYTFDGITKLQKKGIKLWTVETKNELNDAITFWKRP